AVQVIAGVQRSIGEMAEIGRGMRDLQEFLRSPKLRGAIGEQVLRELLGQTLPKQAFHLQYTFKSGVIVDAAIKTEAGLVPIDSKFPMDNFRKMMAAKTEREKKTHRRQLVIDVKKHIKDISSKYILTKEGTLDYALMYIPSEAVYYEIMANIPELADYAHEMRVLPVSPSTFYAYLRAILMSFEGRKIEQRARQILSVIRAVQKDYTKLEGNLSVLGKHIQNAYNQMHNVLSGFTLLGQKLSSTQALGEKKRETEIKQLEIKEK
ncbi:MAG: DNA recombination protein RmuC, partial [Candidatus Zixiibacteriota bacterium]